MYIARSFLAALVLLCSFAAFASPKITSISPTSGPAAGGTTVTIRGTGFSNNCIICSPPFADPEIYFGSERALSVHFIDPTTIEAVTPPNMPVRVAVSISQLDGSNPNYDTFSAFTYTGDVYDSFDPILFPVYTPPVHGAFGSEFHTSVRAYNHSFSELRLYGHDMSCHPLADPPGPAEFGTPLPPRASELELYTLCSQSIGRLMFVPKGRAKDLAASIRVRDITRQSKSYGVDIPVVKPDDFSDETISLLGVPIDPRFRNTLRIYSLKRGENFVNVTVNGQLHQLFFDAPGDLFTPAVITFTDFPQAALPEGGTATVTIDVPRGPGATHIPGTPIWAFISTTNNETQEITTITPN